MSESARKILRKTADGRLAFWCTACKCAHALDARWTVTGPEDRPTAAPSLLVRTGHHVPGQLSDECWCTYNAKHPNDPAPFTCSRCHLFVRDGRIEYLSDCTHELAGKTVPMEPF